MMAELGGKMKHRDEEAMVFNACEAIPVSPRPSLSANQIYKTQNKPRLPMREIEDLCEAMVNTGDMEVEQYGHMRCYRWLPLPSNSNSTTRDVV